MLNPPKIYFSLSDLKVQYSSLFFSPFKNEFTFLSQYEYNFYNVLSVEVYESQVKCSRALQSCGR